MLLTAESRNDNGVYLPEPSVVKKVLSHPTSSGDTVIAVETSPTTTTIRNLELDRVKEIFQGYDLLNISGAVSCVVCGKSYKSKVCVKKHLWEHSIYWDLFDGLKKQQRVLSIQAALILAIKFNPSLSLLLVTQSSNNVKKNKSGEKVDNEHVKNSNRTDESVVKSNNSNNNSNITSRKRKLDNIMIEDKTAYKCLSLQKLSNSVTTSTTSLEVLPKQ